jgi:hypothetical protein
MRTFLKVLLGTRRFRVLGAYWDLSGARSGCRSSLFSRCAGVGICFSFPSLVLFLELGCVAALASLLYRLFAILI